MNMINNGYINNEGASGFDMTELCKNFIIMISIIGCLAIAMHPEWRSLVAASYEAIGTEALQDVIEKQEDAIEKRLEKLREESGEKTDAEILKENRWGLFITGTYGKLDRDTTQREVGYEADLTGFTVGADYRLNADLILGGAFGYYITDTEFENRFGDAESYPVSFSLYTEYLPMDNAFVNLTMGYTETEIDFRRNVFGATGAQIGQANAEYDGRAFNVAFNSGYDWHFGAFSIGPRIGLNYAHIDNEDMVETSGGNSAINLEGEVNDSLFTSIGIQAGHSLSLPWGVLRTEVGGYYVHEFMDDSKNLLVTNIASGAQTFFITDEPDRDNFIARAGLIYSIPRGIDFFVHYEGLFGHSYMKSHIFNFGARIGF